MVRIAGGKHFQLKLRRVHDNEENEVKEETMIRNLLKYSEPRSYSSIHGHTLHYISVTKNEKETSNQSEYALAWFRDEFSTEFEAVINPTLSSMYRPRW